MEIAPGLEMKAPSAMYRVDEQLSRLEGCRKTPALMCSWRGPSRHAPVSASQEHSNALKKVKSWRGLAKGQSLFWNRSEHEKPEIFLDSRTRLNPPPRAVSFERSEPALPLRYYCSSSLVVRVLAKLYSSSAPIAPGLVVARFYFKTMPH